MELCIFHEKIYGKYKNQLFVFESTWDSFRPIEKVGWDGEQYSILDTLYKTDLFDDNYGYGSIAMKTLCKTMTDETELGDAKEITDPLTFWKWCGEKEAKWWYDRACVFTDKCVPRDSGDWKKYLHYLHVRARTLRRPLIGRLTRKRLVVK